MLKKRLRWTLALLKRIFSKKLSVRVVLAVASAVAILCSFVAVDAYTVIDGDRRYDIKTYAKEPADVLDAAGINLNEGDILEYEVTQGRTTIYIDRTFSTNITFETKLAAKELADSAVMFADDLMFGSSQTVTDLEEAFTSENGLPNECEIEYVYETVTQPVKFKYKTVYSKNLLKGETKVTAGKNGEKEVTYLKKMINGMVVSTEKSSEKVTKAAVNQVETIGTRVQLSSSLAVMTSDDVKAISTLKPKKPIELDKKGQPIKYANVITGKASAYCGCCDGNSTAYFGKNSARPGYVAVNPKQIPYGTKLYIVSADGKKVYGYAIAADTGGFAKNGSGRVVDVRMPTGSKCRCGSNWGVRKVYIYILE